MYAYGQWEQLIYVVVLCRQRVRWLFFSKNRVECFNLYAVMLLKFDVWFYLKHCNILKGLMISTKSLNVQTALWAAVSNRSLESNIWSETWDNLSVLTKEDFCSALHISLFAQIILETSRKGRKKGHGRKNKLTCWQPLYLFPATVLKSPSNYVKEPS